MWRLPQLSKLLAGLAIALSVGALGYSSGESNSSQALNWSKPFNLSNSEQSSADPIVAADQYGYVHVFWSEDVDGEPHEFDTPPGGGNSIYYRRLDPQGNWTEPIDIVYVWRAGGRATNPNVLVDQTGQIHLTWIENGALAYSYVQANQAVDTKAWSTPVFLTGPTVNDSRILEVDDAILVIFTVRTGPLPGVHAVQIVDGISGDLKLVWLGDEYSEEGARLMAAARDSLGTVHVVWEVASPPGWQPHAVRYARSTDGGVSWSPSRIVARETSRESGTQNARPWVAVTEGDDVHIQWVQGRLTYRWHQISFDGGDTWEIPYQIWPDFVSNTNSQAVGVDAAGVLHWVDVLRYPNGAYSMEWEGDTWTTPSLFYLMQEGPRDPLGDRINTHRFRMAISLGNHIHIVFHDQDRAEVYHMTAKLDAPGIPPAPEPTMSAPPMSLPDSTPDIQISEEVAAPTQGVLAPVGQPATESGPSPSYPVMIGLASSVFLVGLVFLATRFR